MVAEILPSSVPDEPPDVAPLPVVSPLPPFGYRRSSSFLCCCLPASPPRFRPPSPTRSPSLRLVVNHPPSPSPSSDLPQIVESLSALSPARFLFSGLAPPSWSWWFEVPPPVQTSTRLMVPKDCEPLAPDSLPDFISSGCRRHITALCRIWPCYWLHFHSLKLLCFRSSSATMETLILSKMYLLKAFDSAPSSLELETSPYVTSLLFLTSPHKSSKLLEHTLLSLMASGPEQQPLWWFVSSPPFLVHLKIVVLKIFESTTFEYNISEDSLVLSSDTTSALIRILTALCRLLLCCCSLQTLGCCLPSLSFEHSLKTSPYLLEGLSFGLISPTLAAGNLLYFVQSWWYLLVALPPTPPVPPDPPDSLNLLVQTLFPSASLWLFAPVLTLSGFGDASFSTAFTGPSRCSCRSHQSFMLLIVLPSTGSVSMIPWNIVKLTSCCLVLDFSSVLWLQQSVSRSHLPLHEDSLPLYEDVTQLPFYEDVTPLPLYEDVTVFLPANRVGLDTCCPFASVLEMLCLLCSSLALSEFGARSVLLKITEALASKLIKGFTAVLEIVNCALVAVSILGDRSLYVFSNPHGFVSLTNSSVVEFRGLLHDFILFKCFVALIFLWYFLCFDVMFVWIAKMAFNLVNFCSFYGD